MMPEYSLFMKVLVTNFNGNPNIGLYMFASEKYCLVGLDVAAQEIAQIKKVLKVPVHRLNIAGTSMVGVFCAGNSNKLLIPGIIFDNELAKLDKLKIDYKIIKTHLTALGNNILCNDKGALVNEEFSAAEIKAIKDSLGVPVKTGKIAELDAVGALGVLNKKACLVNTDATQNEIQHIKDILGVDSETCTVNMGNPFVKSGIVCNSNGVIIGDQSGGPEMAYIAEVLGF